MKILLSGIVIALLCACVPAGSTETPMQAAKAGYVDVQAPRRPVDATTIQRNQQIQWFSNLVNFLGDSYVDSKTSKELVDAAIAGMVKSLDPHSIYMPAKEFAEMQVDVDGTFGGLGMEVTMEDGLVKVISPIDDTPAARAGMKSGDFITHVDGQLLYDMTIKEAVDLMRGIVGTECVITVWRKDQGEPFDVTLVRDTINITVVKGHAEGKVAYIRLAIFNLQAYDKFIKMYADLRKEIGEDMQGIVLDLRNNPGGLLNTALFITDAFISEGEIMSIRPRDEEQSQSFAAAPDNDIAVGLPIVVLINAGSASASEIVAGSLQDHNRAIIVGTKSFGKGSVQSIIPLPGGSAIKLTTARYYLPSGRSIQAGGVTPDIIVRPGKIEFEDEQKLRKEADLRGRLEGKGVVIEEEVKATEVDDYQLQRALDIIRGIAHHSEMNK